MKLLNLSSIYVGLSILLFGNLALASNCVGSGGGGDVCQNRIEIIRNNILDWISAGRSSDLDFSKSGSYLSEYNEKMQSVISLTRNDFQGSISCTSYRMDVLVNGAFKTCRSYFENQNENHPKILCFNKIENGKAVDGLMALSEDDQYFQVHHEIAVLAGIEDQKGELGNYPLSSQIAAKLENKVVRQLPVISAFSAQTGYATNGGMTGSAIFVIVSQPVHDRCPDETVMTGLGCIFSRPTNVMSQSINGDCGQGEAFFKGACVLTEKTFLIDPTVAQICPTGAAFTRNGCELTIKFKANLSTESGF